ncbi:MAG TPA: hypothetical protein HA315_02720 [Candidatus Thalassarchaeaceae archaeon]|jgi:membrane-associated protease RseP (regulator of RpoE activity)|nr:MAG TPA: hypothetical protein D7H72_02715 [Candidatus Poseidoniales archaeon]HII34894.1 hypothetical protein [Candidatus Thalassarchaeaceae archaeon]|tara:strand:- start:2743 stop:4254 length:1512 start_codon:yes stop_codon:yes gene_type:complete
MDGEAGGKIPVYPILILSILLVYGILPLWTIIALSGWYLLVLYLEDNGHLDRWNFERVLGIVLMIRTTRGRGFLEYISKNRKFWRFFGEFSIWLCFLVMFAVVFLMIFAFVSSMNSPPQGSLPATDILFIPGVTSFVPFWWPALALVFTLLIHEYSHGIQARAHGMEVKSFGLLVAGPIPVGAFAEPEHMDMIMAPRRERLRLFAAGPAINLVATFIFLIILGFVSSGFIASNPGIHAIAIIDEGGADEAGIMPYDIITHVDGVGVPDYSSFSQQMDSLGAGDVIIFTVIPYSVENGEWGISSDIPVTLGDKRQYYLDRCDGEVECLSETNELLDSYGIEEGEAFLGVSFPRSGTFQTEQFSLIFDDRYSSLEKIAIVTIKPLSMLGTPMSYDGQTMDIHERMMLEVDDDFVLSSLGTEGVLALFDFIFWLIWVNFLLGFLNLLPIIPFDGGHMVKDGTHSILSMFMKDSNPLRVERLAGSISGITTIVMLAVVMIPILMLVV